MHVDAFGGLLSTAGSILAASANTPSKVRYAVATGKAERDLSGDPLDALPPVKSTHFASVTEPKKVAEVLRVLDGYEGTLTVRCALHLAPLVFVRLGELRHVEWTDIDLDAAEWRYTVTKTDNPHLLLSHQAVKILRELPERRKMMPQWGDYPGKLKAGAEVIPFSQRA